MGAVEQTTFIMQSEDKAYQKKLITKIIRVNLGPANLGQVNLGQVNLGQANLGQTQSVYVLIENY